MKIAIEQPRTWARRLTITVPAEHVEHERREVARRLAQRLKLPGFRKGKVPPDVLERRYGPAIEQETVERVVGEAYREALRREGLHPISQGAVEEVEYRPGTDLTFAVEFEVRPELNLSRLGGFRVKRERAPVADEQVDRVLERLREEHATWRTIEDATPASGDFTVVEISPLDAEGQPRTGAKPRRYQIVLGEGQAIPEIEQLLGQLRPGEERDTVVPPQTEEQPPRESREEPVRVRLLEAKHPELPPLDDDFARGVGEFDTLDALRARVRADLEREADGEAERQVRHRLVDLVVEANPFELPDAMVNQYLDRVLRPREGVDPERVAEMRQVARPGAEHALRRMLVIERVAELEGLRATEEEVDTRIAELAGRHGRTAADVRAHLQKAGRLEALREEITEDKVFDYLKGLSTIE
ncbi:MAG: trigger factor [Gemmatimonadetes bacterium]|nr:trigger factor [Gemmatimonadota bacterium]